MDHLNIPTPAAANDTTDAPEPKAKSARPSIIWGGRIFLGLFGVVLPLITLTLEFLSGMCAELFDPIPTVWHVVAIALVAVANGLALYVTTAAKSSAIYLTRVARLNAFALGIAGFYALWFLPMTPFAAIGIIFFGLGLLPLSPLLSFLIALHLRRGLNRQSRALGKDLPHVWCGLLAGFACLLALEVPGVLRVWAIDAVAHGNEVKQSRSLWVLRHAGNEEQLLRGCYANPDAERAAVLQLLFGQTSQTDRRQVYYRVAGRSFNSVPAPSHALNLFGRGVDRGSREWVWDASQGTEQVGQRLKFLSLKESRIDGTLDGDAALGYLEWTLVFRNDHEFQQREARALIQLPAGAVVSRLTLWINGEEREAAFGGRGQVSQAYQAVVNQRRDPVLVTTKGPDRVLVQCFPIPANGGEMKVRIGITGPLAVNQPAVAQLSLPRIIEQNFSAVTGLSHAMWIEAKSPLSSAHPAYHAENSKTSAHTLRGALTPVEFVSSEAGLAVTRNPTASKTWAHDPRDATHLVVQEIALQPPASGPLAIVIDGSLGMDVSARGLADALDTLPSDFSVSLRIGSDKVLTCPKRIPREIAAWLREQQFAGGQDATSALREAYESSTSRGGTLLWIHGPQPETWSDTTSLEQVFGHRSGQVKLLAFPALPGGNVILEKIGESSDFTVLPRLGKPAEDLLRTLQNLRRGDIVATRRSVLAEDFGSAGDETTASLVRLWAADEVKRLLAGAHPQREAAIRLAVSQHLVTPVTGAVVLETKQQYDAAGLTPGDSDPATATVPEITETLILLALGIGSLFIFARYQRRGSFSARVAASKCIS